MIHGFNRVTVTGIFVSVRRPINLYADDVVSSSVGVFLCASKASVKSDCSFLHFSIILLHVFTALSECLFPC